MKPKRLQHLEKIDNKIQNSRSTVVDLYKEIEHQKDVQNTLIVNKHQQVIYEYQDKELRVDIVRTAIKYNYPEENLECIKPYIENEKTWNNSVPDEIAEKYIELDLYNHEYTKRIPIFIRIINKIRDIFENGGNDL